MTEQTLRDFVGRWGLSPGSLIERNCRTAAYYAYQAIVSALSEMRPVMERLGRRSEWEGIVLNLRDEYKRRKNFAQMLDGLMGDKSKKTSSRLIAE